eukprot:CAMPEP_0198510770 /NCGR_PEP_ID=MMETSP1462-20131121/14394_1 /TAXON_ID=1333877 /ORGANISM="Brandtodinium nutriculum, Strain RCC3387" /LENGTH=126 /DNA_ID=CAMNT_0044240113 /DNA_START=60 /DNA_END=439 /DNA_ORIENTATION=-
MASWYIVYDTKICIEIQSSPGWKTTASAKATGAVTYTRSMGTECLDVVVVELPAQQAERTRGDGGQRELQVRDLGLHEPRLHAPDAPGDHGQEVGDLRVDRQAINGLEFPNLVQQQARRREVHDVP